MKSHKNLLYAGGTVVALLFFALQSGYNPFKGSGEKGEIVTLQGFEELLKEKSNDGKRVAVIGHTGISNSDITIRIGAPLSLAFRSPEPEDQYIDHFPISFEKDGKNACYLPTEFTPEDFIIYDNEGNKVPYNKDVILSFTLERISNAVPEKDEKTGKYAWRYEQIRIDPIE